MTALAARPEDDSETDGFEVVTTSADKSRATIRVRGTLDPTTVPLLTSVLRTHIRAGRRDLHVDLTGAHVPDVAALDPLRETRAALADDGGLLVLDYVAEARLGS
jgi:anti-anti-sigma regulatory factor